MTVRRVWLLLTIGLIFATPLFVGGLWFEATDPYCMGGPDGSDAYPREWSWFPLGARCHYPEGTQGPGWRLTVVAAAFVAAWWWAIANRRLNRDLPDGYVTVFTESRDRLRAWHQRRTR